MADCGTVQHHSQNVHLPADRVVGNIRKLVVAVHPLQERPLEIAD